MKRITIILVILGILGLVAFRLISNKKEINANNQVRDDSKVKVAVNVAKVEKRLNEKNLSLVGTVNANQVIDIKSEVPGKVLSLNVALGDYVRKGQTIARIDNTIRALSLDNAEQKLADAKQNLVRYQNLYEGGAASKAQYDQYKLAYETAENQLAQARKELSNAVVTAPVSGIISEKALEAGAFVNVASPIVTIVDISQLKVKLKVAEKDVYELKTGDPVTITASVLPGQTFEGKIAFISPKGDEAHNYPVEISIENSGKKLKAGTYVDIAFNRKSAVPSLQIPREALTGSVKDAKVYVVDNTNRASLRKIAIGNENGMWLEVLDGLKEGESVVTTGHINLSDNAEVNIIQ